jgi:thymidine kinase
MAVYSDAVDEPRYYDARIVGVISNAIRNNRRVVVVGTSRTWVNLST